MSSGTITIYHNPACETSRKVLATIEAWGHKPKIVHYLEVGWSRNQLQHLAHAMHLHPRDMLRKSDPMVEDLGLLADGVSDDTILDAMVRHPQLVERPIVSSPLGTKICRPAEVVQSLI
jgi:arsenate reductase